MKPSYHSTSGQEPPSQPPIASWLLALQQLHQRLAPSFARPEVHRHALLYLEAVLSDIPRKNGWQIAEQARQERPDGMQRLLSHAVWDHDAVRDELRRLVSDRWQPPAVEPDVADPIALFPVLVLDESGFPKRGHHSAGVAPQYCGRTGRVENCQVGVFLSYVTAGGHALIDRELYVPADWCDDAPRRQAAHLPESVRFATKPELAKRMVQRAQAAGLPIRWVVADTVYGHATDLRLFLEEQGYAYALAVPSIEVVTVQTPSGPLLADVGSIPKEAVAGTDWLRLSTRMGTKGSCSFDWAMLPLLHHGHVDQRHVLVVRRCLDDPHQLSYYRVLAPLETPLPTMVAAIGARWHIEEDLQAAKKLGLDQYEVRSWLGWYRHVTLVLLASAFLLTLCLHEPSPPPAPQAASSCLPTCIALTPPPRCSICSPICSLCLPVRCPSSVTGRTFAAA